MIRYIIYPDGSSEMTDKSAEQLIIDGFCDMVVECHHVKNIRIVTGIGSGEDYEIEYARLYVHGSTHEFTKEI